MLSSLTRRSDAQPVAAPPWHVNFRNYERLPDTKVVRTTFFINTAAIVVSLGMVFWLGYREYHINSLNDQIATAQKEIETNTRQNKEALRLSQIFADEQKKLAEGEAFQFASISPVEFVNLLGRTLPREVSVEYLEARLADASGASFILRGVVAGTPDQASGVASRYVDMLRAHPRLGAIFNPITLTNLNRDQSTGFLTFEIIFKVKSGAK
jgi:hypothetical protein